MSDIIEIYHKLKKWHERFPNLLCISVFLFDDGEFRIRLDWSFGNEHPSYSQIFSKQQMDDLHWFENADEYLMETIEKAYKIYEVGEE